MDHYEMVEKLRQKANVSYEEAKAALEACDWDILDALVLLESEGKVKSEQGAKAYSTQEQPKEKKKEETGEWKEALKRLGKFACKLFKKGNANNFVVRSRKGKMEAEMPITVMVLLLIMCWPLSLIVLVLGLLAGCRYAFEGPDVNEKVNDAMNKAANAVQGNEEKKEEKKEEK